MILALNPLQRLSGSKILLSVVFFLLSIASFAQKIEMRDGKRYIKHEVVAGNTLYGITSLYNVTVEDLKVENPGLTTDLSIGQIIWVPADGVIQMDTIYHKVKKKETVYGITRKYEITEDDFYAWNPEVVEKGLKKGHEVLILRPSVEEKDEPVVSETPVEPIAQTEIHEDSVTTSKESDSLSTPESRYKVEDSVVVYEVMQGETMYSLSKRYMVTQAEIREANPELSGGLKAGMIIHIPLKKITELVPEEGVSALENTSSIKTLGKKKEYVITYLLPLKLDEIDMARLASPDGRPKFHSSSLFSMYYYEGAKMALMEAQKRGLKAKVYCFDVKDTNEFKKLKMNSVLENSDVIFALYGANKAGLQKMLADYSTEKDIQVVFPLGVKKSLLAENPYTISFSQTDVDKAKQLAMELIHLYPGKKLYFVKTGEKSDDVLELAKTFLMEKGVTNELVDYNMSTEGISSTELASLIPNSDTALFILGTQSKLKAGTFMTKLNQLLSESTEEETAVVGFPSEWIKYDEIQLEYFSRANAITIMSEYSANDSINDLFEERKGFTPYGDLVVQGYDMTSYIATMLMGHGLDFVSNNTKVYNGTAIKVLLKRPLDTSGALNIYGVPVQFSKDRVIVYLAQ